MVKFHRKFPFIGQISDICKKASQNIYAVRHSLKVIVILAQNMTSSKKRIIMNADSDFTIII